MLMQHLHGPLPGSPKASASLPRPPTPHDCCPWLTTGYPLPHAPPPPPPPLVHCSLFHLVLTRPLTHSHAHCRSCSSPTSSSSCSPWAGWAWAWQSAPPCSPRCAGSGRAGRVGGGGCGTQARVCVWNRQLRRNVSRRSAAQPTARSRLLPGGRHCPVPLVALWQAV